MPAKLFTMNPLFRRDVDLTTARRRDNRAWLEHCLQWYDIDPSRIIYMGHPPHETRTFTAETAELTQLCFADIDIPEGVAILHDAGTIFTQDGESIFPAIGFAHERAYTSAVHQFLSPNDNRLHGIVKMEWRESGVDLNDDVSSCLLLLNRLDCVSEGEIKDMFDRNFLWDNPRPTIEEVLPLVRGDFRIQVERSTFFQQCIDDYYLETHAMRSAATRDIPHGLECELNGRYWSFSLKN